MDEKRDLFPGSFGVIFTTMPSITDQKFSKAGGRISDGADIREHPNTGVKKAEETDSARQKVNFIGMGGRGVVVIKYFGSARDLFENRVPFERISEIRISECVILILTANKISKNWGKWHPAWDRKGFFFVVRRSGRSKGKRDGVMVRADSKEVSTVVVIIDVGDAIKGSDGYDR